MVAHCSSDLPLGRGADAASASGPLAPTPAWRCSHWPLLHAGANTILVSCAVPRTCALASGAQFRTLPPLSVARDGFSAAAILLSSRPNLYPPKTLLPLVARLGADSIFLAQSAKIERLHRSHCKLHSLFHRFTFLPRHAEVLPHHATPKCYLCIEPIVLPMFSQLPVSCPSMTDAPVAA